jgi:TonB-linked SusC/RagA family outer membrane protein
MRRLTLLLVSLVLLSIQSVLAQSFSVKGTVVSADDNEPMIGVTIMQEGTSNGVVTDIDGNYTIEIKGASKATLAYSYVGCVTQKHVVKAQTNTLNITLASDSKMMDEVVVVAYGVRKKGTIAGSVSAVKSEKIENVPAASFDQALQGQSTGLQVISSSGEPSKAATFQIRGTNSINSGKSPLFILDGVPISSSDFNTLSPNDIESISVLKDASSTSIYGARAANGVVVITSKRGLAMDKAKITLRAQYGFSELAQTNWKMMNTDERIQFEKEVGLDTGKDYNLLSRVNVNWLDEVFNDRAPLQSYELSINRATDRLNYYVSGGFYDQDGIAQNSTFRRYNIRTNADVKAGKWLKVGTNTMAAYEEAQQADDGSYTTVTPISACRFMLPYWNPYAKDGSLASLAAGNWAGTSENPIVYMGLNPIKNKKYKVLSTMYAEIYPIENLTIRTQFGADFTHSTAFLQSFPSLSSNNGQGTAARQSSDAINLTETTTANYRFSLNDIHSFNVMLGQEAVNYHSEGFQVYSKGQTSDLLTNVSSGTRASRWADSSSDYSYLSFFMRGEYNYKELYYADFSLRTDASSRFGKDHRWGTFWSLGFMYNVKSTDWLKDMKWLSTAQTIITWLWFLVVPTTIILPVSILRRVVTRNWVGSQPGLATSPSVWVSSTESTSVSRLTTSVPPIC